MEGDRFQVDYELSDYGKLLFEYDEELDELNMSKQKRKAMLKSPAFYVVVALIFLLVVWFVACMILTTIKDGFLVAVFTHCNGIFLLIVFGLILVLSFTGSWGKFLRWASKSKHTSTKEFIAQEEDVEFERERQKYSIQIYEDYFVITNKGNARIFDMHQLEEVRLDSADDKTRHYIITFKSRGGQRVTATVKIPNNILTIMSLKRIFNDKLKIHRPAKVAVKKCNKPVGTLVGLTVFVSIFILVGIGLILMHYYVTETVPIVLGVFFIISGVCGLCGVYDFVPVLKDTVLPLLASVIFIILPISIVRLSFNSNGMDLTFKTFVTNFNAFTAATVCFGFIALIGVFASIRNIVDYIRYRENKNK